MSRDSLHTTEINAKIENLGSSGGTIATSADELFDAVDKDESGVISRAEVHPGSLPPAPRPLSPPARLSRQPQ